MNNNVKRASGQRPRKRKFEGNRFTKCNLSQGASASSKKLNSSLLDNSFVETDNVGYRIVDIDILSKVISNNLCCKMCGSDVELSETRVHGLSSVFQISCKKCNELKSFRNSRMMGEKSNIPEINMRFTYAMRCIGQGLCSMKNFCGAMDLPPPVQKSAYNRSLEKIANSVSNVASTSMLNATQQEIEMTGQSHLTVSGDGSWKTRGHSSKIGITSVIGVESGKVLDIEVMSSYCKRCEIGIKNKKGKELADWKKSHEKQCVKNHSGSAAMMEVNGMLKIFRRSEEKYKAQYLNYIGDGDTKTFLELKKSHVYGADKELKKVECVGHIQKRMGSRLRELKNSMRGKKLEDGKSLFGKGRLTDKLIVELTTYYGGAIRNNKNSVMDMRKAIWAIYFHKRSNDQEPLHDFCPQGDASWCKYQKAKAEGKLKNFHHKNVIPAPVMDSIKKIFKDLSDPKLLNRCLGGRTQNPNESFNSLVWKFCPKISGSSRIIADIAANEALVAFNEGRKGRLQIMNSLGFRVGQFALQAANKIDMQRIAEAEKNATEYSLEVRRNRHMINCSKLEKIKEREGIIYESGKF